MRESEKNHQGAPSPRTSERSLFGALESSCALFVGHIVATGVKNDLSRRLFSRPHPHDAPMPEPCRTTLRRRTKPLPDLDTVSKIPPDFTALQQGCFETRVETGVFQGVCNTPVATAVKHPCFRPLQQGCRRHPCHTPVSAPFCTDGSSHHPTQGIFPAQTRSLCAFGPPGA